MKPLWRTAPRHVPPANQYYRLCRSHKSTNTLSCSVNISCMGLRYECPSFIENNFIVIRDYILNTLFNIGICIKMYERQIVIDDTRNSVISGAQVSVS